MSKFVIGIDVGGTNIKLGVVNPQGKVVSRAGFSTKVFGRNKAKLIQALVQYIKALLQENQLSPEHIKGIGIGLPGLINPVKGEVIFLPNIAGWKNVPLKKLLEKHLPIKVFLENDVNMITLGEWKFGAGKGFQNVLGVTLGTGVGGGLILNGQIYRGKGFAAGEIGHIPLNENGPRCGCGGYGCFERYVGNRYVLKEAAKFFRQSNIDFPDIRRLTQQRHPKAPLFWRTLGEHIGNGLVGAINLLNPSLVILGGGVAHHNYNYLSPTIKKVVQRRAMKVQKAMAKIVKAKLGDDAGIIGAQVLVNQEAVRASHE